MDHQACWLYAAWTIVREHLPPAPAKVLELGCGPLGGFVSALAADGYQPTGVDPVAPDRTPFHRIEFELFELPERVECVVACTSLHHVDDLEIVLDHVVAAVVPGGTVIVVEWAWERFDEPTARWCFDRLADEPGPDDATWLHRQRDRWLASGQPWEEYQSDWATSAGLHTGAQMVRGLAERFETQRILAGPYFFCDLSKSTEADEMEAVTAGVIQPTRLLYVGTLADRPREL